MDERKTDLVNLYNSKQECTYTNCYCEENVWHLCNSVKKDRPAELGKCYCVFISNKEQTIPLWHQTSSKQADGCVVWDYHVIFLHETEVGTFVYDLDSRLEFPCGFEKYVSQGVRSCAPLKEQYRRYFRVIPAERFLETFASNRSHMLNDKNEWLKPPPDYPCIRTEVDVNNIKDFISMDSLQGEGTVMDLGQIYSKFTTPNT